MFRSRTKAGVTRRRVQENPPSTTQLTEQIAAQSSSEREPLSSPCTRDTARTAPRSNPLGLAAQVRSVFFALVLVVTTLVVGSGEAFGAIGKFLPITIRPSPNVSLPPPQGPPAWLPAPSFRDHIINVELTQGWPGSTKYGASPPLIRGGGHWYDPDNPNGLHHYLGTLATAQPSSKGIPKYFVDDVDVRTLVRNHYGIPLDMDLDTPQSMWNPGVITRNVYQHPNGVSIVNIPEPLYRPKTFEQLLQLDYTNDIRYLGGRPGDKTIFPDHFSEYDIFNMLAILKSSPTAHVEPRAISGVACGFRLQGMGYEVDGFHTFYPTFNQPNGQAPRGPFNVGPVPPPSLNQPVIIMPSSLPPPSFGGG